MGYGAVIAIGVIVLVALFIGIMAGAKKPPTGKDSGGGDKTPSQPSADAPTPGRSQVESNRQASNADRKTPPA